MLDLDRRPILKSVAEVNVPVLKKHSAFYACFICSRIPISFKLNDLTFDANLWNGRRLEKVLRWPSIWQTATDLRGSDVDLSADVDLSLTYIRLNIFKEDSPIFLPLTEIGSSTTRFFIALLETFPTMSKTRAALLSLVYKDLEKNANIIFNITSINKGPSNSEL